MPPFHHSKRTSIISLFPALGAPNSAKFRGGGLQRASQVSTKDKFDKLFTFYALKIILFRVFRVIKKGLLLRILRYKKVPFLEFLRKAIKKDSHLKIFTL